MRPTAAEEYPQGRLLGEPKATRVLLQFLASTSVALPPGTPTADGGCHGAGVLAKSHDMLDSFVLISLFCFRAEPLAH